jgi:hypothetical protein
MEKSMKFDEKNHKIQKKNQNSNEFLINFKNSPTIEQTFDDQIQKKDILDNIGKVKYDKGKAIKSNPNVKIWDINKLLFINQRNISGQNIRLKLRKLSRSKTSLTSKLNRSLTTGIQSSIREENKRNIFIK